ncbi:MAG TPA: type II toxin-antitoxin system VapC family toxin [Terriglobia bacterium]|nr:type II toxin-antitoxin system VapC family toxin [Terriglobia bacterium]
MTAFVLDASITIGWMIDRPVPARASLARRLVISGEVPVVPVLWNHEVSNAVVMAERRGRLTADQVKTVADDLEELCDILEIDPLNVRPAALIETARRANLTVYDAAYLELAVRRRLPLATLDDQLREAARRYRIELI